MRGSHKVERALSIFSIVPSRWESWVIPYLRNAADPGPANG